MPFSESMISVLKSNKSIMVDKSKRFRKTLGGYGKNRKPSYDFPKATPEQLLQIRQKMKRENRVLYAKVVIVTLIVFVGLLWVFFKE